MRRFFLIHINQHLIQYTSHLLNKMEAKALYDFEAMDEDELSFNTGDKLLVIHIDEDVKWVQAELNDKIGYVPSNYIEMKDHNWYYGRTSRVNSELILLNSFSGSFLIRNSESSPSDFSLSLQTGDEVQHFRIFRDLKKKFYIWDVHFDSLNELVEYHRKHFLTQQIKLIDLSPIFV